MSPEPYYADDMVTLYHGDCLDVLRQIPDGSIDAIVTDPPYGLGFMGKAWDSPGGTGDYPMRRFDAINTVNTGASRQGGRQRSSEDWAKRQARDARAYGEWCEQWATECLRVLKPGGHLLAFGGTRTYHRIACAVEDAGFEVRDSIAWLYGSGFPKSLDVSKAIDKAAGAEREVTGPNLRHHGGGTNHVYAQDQWTRENFANKTMLTAPATSHAEIWQGWGTALKPAHEPIVVARKSLDGTVAANVLAHGAGALNIDGCRVATDEVLHTSPVPNDMRGGHHGSRHRAGEPSAERRYTERGGTDFAATPGPRGGDAKGRWPTNVLLDDTQAAALDEQTGTLTSGLFKGHRTGDKFRTAYGEFKGDEEREVETYGDSGGASRFFPTFHYEAKAPASERPEHDGTVHPTVKPLDLMRWLVRLVTPPGGTVLEPFAGSGTTAEACVIEGFKCIAIEREAAYLPLIVARLSKPIEPVLDFTGGAA